MSAHLVRLAGVEDDVPDAPGEPLHLGADLEAAPVLGDAVDPQPPVVHRLGDHEVAPGPDLVVIQPLHRVLRILGNGQC